MVLLNEHQILKVAEGLKLDLQPQKITLGLIAGAAKTWKYETSKLEATGGVKFALVDPEAEGDTTGGAVRQEVQKFKSTRHYFVAKEGNKEIPYFLNQKQLCSRKNLMMYFKMLDCKDMANAIESREPWVVHKLLLDLFPNGDWKNMDYEVEAPAEFQAPPKPAPPALAPSTSAPPTSAPPTSAPPTLAVVVDDSGVADKKDPPSEHKVVPSPTGSDVSGDSEYVVGYPVFPGWPAGITDKELSTTSIWVYIHLFFVVACFPFAVSSIAYAIFGGGLQSESTVASFGGLGAICFVLLGFRSCGFEIFGTVAMAGYHRKVEKKQVPAKPDNKKDR